MKNHEWKFKHIYYFDWKNSRDLKSNNAHYLFIIRFQKNEAFF